MTATDPALRHRLLVLGVCCLSLLITVLDTTAATSPGGATRAETRAAAPVLLIGQRS